MNNKENELQAEKLDAQNAYWALPYVLTVSIEAILRKNPIKREFAGYYIDLGKQFLFLGTLELDDYLLWLEKAYPEKAKKIRERVREADKHYLGRNYEAMKEQ